ncbi:MAG: alcohol dehydrogenase catalytic domain-containing protein [Candidatus Margulisiibacteriota bacterium]
MVGVPYRQARLDGGRVFIDAVAQTRAYPLVVKVNKAGICRADVKEVQGTRTIKPDEGSVFGHEFIGKIFHSSVDGLEPGMPVTFVPNVTRDRTTGFAQYFFINGSNEQLRQAILPLSPDLTDRDWLPEPFSTVINSIDSFMRHARLSNLTGFKVGVLGAGTAGLEFGFLTTFLGADATIFNRGQARIDFARKIGFFESSKIRAMSEHTQFANSFDVVVVAPSIINHDILAIAAELVKNEGYIDLYGGLSQGLTFFDGDVDVYNIRRLGKSQTCTFNGKRFTSCGAQGSGCRDFLKAFEYFGRHRTSFPLDRLISTRIAFADLPATIMRMASSTDPIDFPGRVLVEFND